MFLNGVPLFFPARSTSGAAQRNVLQRTATSFVSLFVCLRGRAEEHAARDEHEDSDSRQRLCQGRPAPRCAGHCVLQIQTAS